ncbi:MAG: Carboxymuconolactone decarboxylase family protein [Alphaproteobacteria bacterium ADurb.Bin438]|nr:MAG: Carboxymuconolactone decarboxylase family protein [Alphaproteobacteria bacterium ADurb.Bin438]
MTDYKEVESFFNKSCMELAKVSEEYRSFGALAKNTLKDGTAIPPKTKEMIAIALGIAARCNPCIVHHVKLGIQHGLTREEMVEVINISILMGGGPSSMYGAAALACYDEFSVKKTAGAW